MKHLTRTNAIIYTKDIDEKLSNSLYTSLLKVSSRRLGEPISLSQQTCLADPLDKFVQRYKYIFYVLSSDSILKLTEKSTSNNNQVQDDFSNSLQQGLSLAENGETKLVLILKDEDSNLKFSLIPLISQNQTIPLLNLLKSAATIIEIFDNLYSKLYPILTDTFETPQQEVSQVCAIYNKSFYEKCIKSTEKSLINEGIAALCGVEGIGKTFLAKYISQTLKDRYSSTILITCDSIESILYSFHHLSTSINVDLNNLDDSEVLDTVFNNLAFNKRTSIIILDGLDDPAVCFILEKHFSKFAGDLLITTKAESPDELQGLLKAYPKSFSWTKIETWDIQEIAIFFDGKFGSSSGSGGDLQLIQKIGFDGRPLTLVTASTYLEMASLTLFDFQSKQSELILSKPKLEPGTLPTLLELISVSLRQTGLLGMATIALLTGIAVLERSSITKNLVKAISNSQRIRVVRDFRHMEIQKEMSGGEIKEAQRKMESIFHNSPTSKPAAEGHDFKAEIPFSKVFDNLLVWKFIEFDEATDLVSIHPLMQKLCQRMSNGKYALEEVSSALSSRFTFDLEDDYLKEQVDLATPLLGHVIKTTMHYKDLTQKIKFLDLSVVEFLVESGISISRSQKKYILLKRLCEIQLSFFETSPPNVDEKTALMLRARALHQFSDALFLAKEFQLASDEYSKTVDQYRKLVEKNDVEIIVPLLNKMGDCFLAMEDIDKAMLFYGQAMDCISSKDNLQLYADGLKNIGNCLIKRGEYHAAKESYEEALEIQKKIGDLDQLAIEYDLFSVVLELHKEYELSSKYIKKSITVKESFYHTRNHPSIAKSLNQLGMISHVQTRFPKALVYCKEALDIYISAYHTKSNLNVAKVLNNIGAILMSIGDIDQAILKFEESLKIKTALKGQGDHLDVAKTLHNLGDANKLKKTDDGNFLAMNYYTQALEIFQRSFGTIKKPEIALILNNMGVIANNQGDYDHAISLHLSSLAIKLFIFNGARDDLSVSTSLSNLGQASRQKGDLKSAKIYYREALDIKILNYQTKQNLEVATNMVKLGVISELEGDFKSALEYYTEALATREQIHETREHDSVIKLVRKIANAHYLNKDFKKAVEWYDDAAATQKKVVNSVDDFCIAQILKLKGDVYFKIGDFTKSNEFYVEALEMREKIFHASQKYDEQSSIEWNENIDVIELYVCLARVAEQSQNVNEALSNFRKAVKLSKSVHHENDDYFILLYKESGRTLQRLGQLDMALQYHQDLLAVQKAILKKDNHIDFAETYYTIGFILENQGKLETCLDSYFKCYDVYTKNAISNTNPSFISLHLSLNSLIESLRHLSNKFNTENNFAKSEEYLHLILMINLLQSKNNRQTLEVAETVKEIGARKRDAKNFEESSIYLQEALETFTLLKKTRECVEVSDVLYHTAQLYRLKARPNGDKEFYLSLFSESLNILKNLNIKSIHPVFISVSQSILEIGKEFHDQGLKDKAFGQSESSEKNLMKGLDLLKSVYGAPGSSIDKKEFDIESTIVISLNVLAQITIDKKSNIKYLLESIAYQKQSKTSNLIFTTVVSPPSTRQSTYTSTCISIAQTYETLLDFKSAASYYLEAWDLRKKHYSKDQTNVEVLNALSCVNKIASKIEADGENENDHGDYITALKVYNSAFDLYIKIHDGKGNADVGRILTKIGRVLEKRKEFKQALEYYLDASNSYVLANKDNRSCAHVACSLINLGRMYEIEGVSERALVSFEESVDIFTMLNPQKNSKDQIEAALSLSRFAIGLSKRGEEIELNTNGKDYDSAFFAYNQSTNLSKKAICNDERNETRRNHAIVLKRLALFLNKQNNHESALKKFKELVEVQNEFGGDTQETAPYILQLEKQIKKKNSIFSCCLPNTDVRTVYPV